MAAFRVLYDLLGHADPKHRAHMEQLLSVHGFSRFYAIANALKHADRNPDARVPVLRDTENEGRIGLALIAYRILANDLTPEMGGFHLMSLSAYPENFRVVADKDPDIEAGAQYAAALMRDNIDQRRLMAQAFIDSMRNGVLPANVSLKRSYHSD